MVLLDIEMPGNCEECPLRIKMFDSCIFGINNHMDDGTDRPVRPNKCPILDCYQIDGGLVIKKSALTIDVLDGLSIRSYNLMNRYSVRLEDYEGLTIDDLRSVALGNLSLAREMYNVLLKAGVRLEEVNKDD